MIYIEHYRSPLGGITIAGSGSEITGLWFDGQKYFGSTLSSEYEEKSLPVFTETKKWLDIYFSGKEPDFTPPLKWETTPFRKAVWEILLTIPYGQTMTYGEIGERISMETLSALQKETALWEEAPLPEKIPKSSGKMSAQAVGGAVGHNPISLIIPCHRVVGADGKLTGYAGGLEKKRQLLILEKADSVLRQGQRLSPKQMGG